MFILWRNCKREHNNAMSRPVKERMKDWKQIGQTKCITIIHAHPFESQNFDKSEYRGRTFSGETVAQNENPDSIKREWRGSSHKGPARLLTLWPAGLMEFPICFYDLSQGIDCMILILVMLNMTQIQKMRTRVWKVCVVIEVRMALWWWERGLCPYLPNRKPKDDG